MVHRIVANPKMLAGKPVIKGTRIPVYLVLNLLAHGYTHERIIQAYPQLKRPDIKASLEYAQALTRREEEFSIPRVVMQ